MNYDAITEAYTRQAEILEQRLRELRADDTHRQDDTYSCRVALLQREIRDLLEIAAVLKMRGGGSG